MSGFARHIPPDAKESNGCKPSVCNGKTISQTKRGGICGRVGPKRRNINRLAESPKIKAIVYSELGYFDHFGPSTTHALARPTENAEDKIHGTRSLLRRCLPHCWQRCPPSFEARSKQKLCVTKARPESCLCPYIDAALRGLGWSRRAADSFPRSRSMCGPQPSRNRSAYARIRFCPRPWA